MHWHRLFLSSFCFFLLLLFSCAKPVEQRVRITKADLLKGVEVSAPVRIHTLNGSVFLASEGFTIKGDTIFCFAKEYDLKRSPGGVLSWRIPVDSIAGMEYFAMETSSLRDLGNAMLGTTLTAYTVSGTIIILKVVFGSCPTFYTYDGDKPALEAEGFSYSIGKYFEVGDLDRLHVSQPPGGLMRLAVRNEALETHYINQVEVRYLDHPEETEAYPGVEPGTVHVMKPKPPLSAVSMNGRSVLGAILTHDTTSYESDEGAALRFLPEGKRDYIECELENPTGSSTMTLVLRGRNTLQNTVLLYDVMMRNQGPLVMEWIQKINESPWYSWRLYRWYKEHSGIQVLVEHNGEFEPVERIPDTGPIAWKETAVQVPVDPGSKKVRIRLAFLPESWAIDWVAYDDQEYDDHELTRVSPAAATNNREMDNQSIVRRLRKDDDEYLLTYPGTTVDLSFEVPAQTAGRRTFFVWSKGYYVEWVRGEWLKARDDVIVFDLANPTKISTDLAQYWSQKRSRLKEQFYAQKIPLAR